MVNEAKAQNQSPPEVVIPPDGIALYRGQCADCHGSLPVTDKPDRVAVAIQAAIDNNVGGMGGLSVLTAEEVQAIADALAL